MGSIQTKHPSHSTDPGSQGMQRPHCQSHDQSDTHHLFSQYSSLSNQYPHYLMIKTAIHSVALGMFQNLVLWELDVLIAFLAWYHTFLPQCLLISLLQLFILFIVSGWALLCGWWWWQYNHWCDTPHSHPWHLAPAPHWTQQHCTLVSCLHHGDSIIIVITNPSNAIALTRTYFIYPKFSLDSIDSYSYTLPEQGVYEL